MLEEAFTLSVRDNDWKYIEPVSKPTPDWLVNKHIPSGLGPKPQLYNLKTDIDENVNLVTANRSQAAKMKAELAAIKKKGTRPGYKK